jgi:hypothetical protein
VSVLLTVDGADYLLSLLGNDPVVERYYLALVVQGNAPGITIGGGELVEPGDDSYARAEIINDSGNWQVMHGTITNATPVAFPLAVSDWGYISYWALTDAPEGGRVFLVGDFPETIFVGEEDQVVLPAGAISFGFDLFGWTE